MTMKLTTLLAQGYLDMRVLCLLQLLPSMLLKVPKGLVSYCFVMGL